MASTRYPSRWADAETSASCEFVGAASLCLTPCGLKSRRFQYRASMEGILSSINLRQQLSRAPIA